MNQYNITQTLKLPPEDVDKLIPALVAGKWIEPPPPEWGQQDGVWVPGEIGRRLMGAKFLKPIPLAEGEAIVAKAVAAAKAFNGQSDASHFISKLVVFGGVFAQKDILHDVDLGISIEKRALETRALEALEEEELQSCGSSTFLDREIWIEHRPVRFLKSTSKYISMHEMKEIEKLGTPFRILLESTAQDRQ